MGIFTLVSLGSSLRYPHLAPSVTKFSLLDCSVIVTACNGMREGNAFSRVRLSFSHSVSLSIHIYRLVGGWPSVTCFVVYLASRRAWKNILLPEVDLEGSIARSPPPDQIVFFHGIFGECWHRIVLVPPLQGHAFLVENPGSTSASKLPFCVSTFTLIGFYLVAKYNTNLTFQFPVNEGGYCYEVTTN